MQEGRGYRLRRLCVECFKCILDTYPSDHVEAKKIEEILKSGTLPDVPKETLEEADRRVNEEERIARVKAEEKKREKEGKSGAQKKGHVGKKFRMVETSSLPEEVGSEEGEESSEERY